MAKKPKLLICELWGLGDLTLATTLIDKAVAQYEAHLLAKPHARDLLGPTYPDVIFHDYVAPWTAHYGKYHLWKWRWSDLFRIIADLRAERFDVAVSVRHDPRDHFLMWLSAARRRIGFPTKGSGVFLHERLREPAEKWHRVESYRELGRRLSVAGIESANPRIAGAHYRTDRISDLISIATKPIVSVHLGAGRPVRHWPEQYWEQTIRQLREKFEFHLVVVPDAGEFGNSLRTLADTFIDALNVRELVDLMARSNLVLCHDSGPMHIAAACEVPTIAFFGPGEPRWFHPWGEKHQMIIRDICPYRPCFDFCRFPENYCLTKMLPHEVWPQLEHAVGEIIRADSRRSGTLTSESCRAESGS
jgi:ADP-heptose:LPS heptosyltransferase